MYTYRNRKTGASFTSAFACTGGDWEEVKPAKEPKVKEPKAEKPKAEKPKGGDAKEQ